MNKKSIGFYLAAAATVCTLIALVFCIVTGTAQKDLSSLTIVLLVLGALAEGITLVKDFYAVGTIAGAVLTGAGIMIPVVTRLNKIGLILSGVVEEAIPAAFIAAVIFALLAILLNCIVGFVGTHKKA